MTIGSRRSETGETLRSRSPLVTMLLVVAVLAAWLIPASYALAWTHHGCQFDDDQPPSITYKKRSMESAYSTAASTAMSWWNSETGSTTWFAWTSSNDPNIDIYDGVYSWSGWAKVTWSCWWATDTYVGDEVQMYYDTDAMDGLTSTEKAIVATHEFGHAYGLDHSSFGCSAPGPVVMKTGQSKFSCSGTPPWANDVDGWEALGY